MRWGGEEEDDYASAIKLPSTQKYLCADILHMYALYINV